MPAFVFDVLIDTIAPFQARAGQVLVLRGESAVVVRRGSTTVLSETTLTPSAVVALLSAGVIRRRCGSVIEKAG